MGSTAKRPTDSRAYPRVGLPAVPVSIRKPKFFEPDQAELLNLSPGGAFLHVKDYSLDPGERLYLDVVEKDGEKLTLVATVVWTHLPLTRRRWATQTGVGVRFLTHDPAVSRLVELLRPATAH